MVEGRHRQKSHFGKNKAPETEVLRGSIAYAA